MFKKILTLIFLSSTLLLSAVPAEAVRTNDITRGILDRLDEVGDRVYNQDPYDNSRAAVYLRVGRIINIVLSFTGLIAVLLVIYGGWLWMTSRGNEDQITNAKKTIISSLIGLSIIIGSFALTSLVVNILVNRVIDN